LRVCEGYSLILGLGRNEKGWYLRIKTYWAKISPVAGSSMGML